MVGNILLDGFPTEYMGYKLNTNCKVGILISLLLKDESIEEDYRMLQAFKLLFVDKVPEIEKALEVFRWFMSCGRNEVFFKEDLKSVKVASNNNEPISFSQDAGVIWATLKLNGIDINKEELHWFGLNYLLSALGDCPLSKLISYRVMDLTELNGDTKKKYKKIQEEVAVKTEVSKEQYEAMVVEYETSNPYEAKVLKRMREASKGY